MIAARIPPAIPISSSLFFLSSASKRNPAGPDYRRVRRDDNLLRRPMRAVRQRSREHRTRRGRVVPRINRQAHFPPIRHSQKGSAVSRSPPRLRRLRALDCRQESFATLSEMADFGTKPCRHAEANRARNVHIPSQDRSRQLGLPVALRCGVWRSRGLISKASHRNV